MNSNLGQVISGLTHLWLPPAAQGFRRQQWTATSSVWIQLRTLSCSSLGFLSSLYWRNERKKRFTSSFIITITDFISGWICYVFFINIVSHKGVQLFLYFQHGHTANLLKCFLTAEWGNLSVVPYLNMLHDETNSYMSHNTNTPSANWPHRDYRHFRISANSWGLFFAFLLIRNEQREIILHSKHKVQSYPSSCDFSSSFQRSPLSPLTPVSLSLHCLIKIILKKRHNESEREMSNILDMEGITEMVESISDLGDDVRWTLLPNRRCHDP